MTNSNILKLQEFFRLMSRKAATLNEEVSFTDIVKDIFTNIPQYEINNYAFFEDGSVENITESEEGELLVNSASLDEAEPVFWEFIDKRLEELSAELPEETPEQENEETPEQKNEETSEEIYLEIDIPEEEKEEFLSYFPNPVECSKVQLYEIITNMWNMFSDLKKAAENSEEFEDIVFTLEDIEPGIPEVTEDEPGAPEVTEGVISDENTDEEGILSNINSISNSDESTPEDEEPAAEVSVGDEEHSEEIITEDKETSSEDEIKSAETTTEDETSAEVIMQEETATITEEPSSPEKDEDDKPENSVPTNIPEQELDDPKIITKKDLLGREFISGQKAIDAVENGISGCVNVPFTNLSYQEQRTSDDYRRRAKIPFLRK